MLDSDQNINYLTKLNASKPLTSGEGDSKEDDIDININPLIEGSYFDPEQVKPMVDEISDKLEKAIQEVVLTS